MQELNVRLYGNLPTVPQIQDHKDTGTIQASGIHKLPNSIELKIPEDDYVYVRFDGNLMAADKEEDGRVREDYQKRVMFSHNFFIYEKKTYRPNEGKHEDSPTFKGMPAYRLTPLLNRIKGPDDHPLLIPFKLQDNTIVDKSGNPIYTVPGGQTNPKTVVNEFHQQHKPTPYIVYISSFRGTTCIAIYTGDPNKQTTLPKLNNYTMFKAHTTTCDPLMTLRCLIEQSNFPVTQPFIVDSENRRLSWPGDETEKLETTNPPQPVSVAHSVQPPFTVYSAPRTITTPPEPVSDNIEPGRPNEEAIGKKTSFNFCNIFPGCFTKVDPGGHGPEQDSSNTTSI